METKLLKLYKNDRLIDALRREGMDNIPSNIILDKRIPGIGATYTEIHSLRNSIIIEPNVPVIKGKIKKHADLNLLGIYEGVKESTIKKYLSNTSTQFKKLLTTPEGFRKIRKAAHDLQIDIYSDYFCLLDECERLNQDVGYREKITNPVSDFFRFTNKAFVSATPLDIHHPQVYSQGFYKLQIDPQFEYKKDIEILITNDFANVLIEKLESLKYSRCICIFYNSTSGIDSLIHSQRMQYNYKTFCSPKSKNKLNKLGFKNVESDFYEPLSNYNFFTSRYFSAIDIDLKVKPDIIILSDLNQAEHTIIDPFTEAIQIQGRFRTIFEDGTNYNSLTHISNIKGDLKVKTNEQLDIEIEQFRKNHEFLLNQYQHTQNQFAKEAILKDLKRSTYYELLDEDWKLDEFAVHNKYNEERVRGYYKNFSLLKKAYEDTGFFNVKSNDPDLRFFLNEERLKIRTKEGIKQKWKRIVSFLKNAPDIEEFRKMLILEDFSDANLIVDAYIKLGEKFIESVDYSRKKIKTKLEKIQNNEKRFCAEITLEIFDHFELNIKKPKQFYKEELKKIYSRYGIDYKVNQNTIKDYCEISIDNSTKPASIILKKFVVSNNKESHNFFFS